MQRSLADLNRQWQRWIMIILLSVLLLGCCAGTGLLGWFFAPLSPYFANHLDTVRGKLDLIAPAQWHPGGGIMSPDGRSMLVGWQRYGYHESFVWDLVTGERRNYKIDAIAGCWLNAEQFFAFDNTSYYLMYAHDAALTRATVIAPFHAYAGPDGKTQLLARWRAAEQVYALTNFSFSTTTVLTIERGQPYVYIDLDTATSVTDTIINDVPHVSLPAGCSIPLQLKPTPSPDGRFYAQLSQGSNTHLLIYTHEGILVAEAGKNGWNVGLLGWAHDSSGVYFLTAISGEAAALMAPYTPIFKLSPLTPEEAWAQWWWSVGKWTAGGAAMIAIIELVVWWRRRMRLTRYTL